MGRQPRIHFFGAVYHIMARGNAGQPVFIDDASRRIFLHYLNSAQRSRPFDLFGYCLMTNHFHLLLSVREHSTAEIMQPVLTCFSKYMNRRKQTTGHIFQARYKSILCNKDSYLLELIRYMHLNPVRAGMVVSADQWPWSSHRDYLRGISSGAVDPRAILSMLGSDAETAREAYLSFLAETPLPNPETPSDEISQPIPPAQPEEPRNLAEQVAVRRAERPSLSDIAARAAGDLGLSDASIIGNGRQRLVVSARRSIIREASLAGFRSRDIAVFLGVKPSTVYKVLELPPA